MRQRNVRMMFLQMFRKPIYIKFMFVAVLVELMDG